MGTVPDVEGDAGKKTQGLLPGLALYVRNSPLPLELTFPCTSPKVGRWLPGLKSLAEHCEILCAHIREGYGGDVDHRGVFSAFMFRFN